MSPASYLTAPPRVAASIVAKVSSECGVASIAAVTLFWLAFAVSVLPVLASAVFVTLRGVEAFRAFKQLGGRAGSGLARIEAGTAELERRLSLAEQRGARLEDSLVRLRRSRAELTVLTAALDEAIGPALPPGQPCASESRRRGPGDELDPSPRRRRQRHGRRGRAAPRDHAARRGRRRAAKAAPAADRACPQRALRLPARAGVARRDAHAVHRHERGAGRRERRGLPRRDRVELRLHDSSAHRRRGGGADAARRSGRSSPARSSSTSAAARRSSRSWTAAFAPASTSAACA